MTILEELKQHLSDRERADDMNYFLTMLEFQEYRERVSDEAWLTRKQELSALIKVLEDLQAGKALDINELQSILES